MAASAAERIRRWDATWGWLNTRTDRQEKLVVVSGIRRKSDLCMPATSSWQEGHYLRADQTTYSGVWYRVDPEVHAAHLFALTRGIYLQTDYLRQKVLNGWVVPPVDSALLVITWSSQSDEDPVWTAWRVSGTAATPCEIEIVADISPLSFLGDAWPVHELSSSTVLLIGVGSIGSVAAEVLAAYAVGRLILVDPDRLLPHNIVRHRLGVRDLGRHKVAGMVELLQARFPDTIVEPHPLDVVVDADAVRPMVGQADVVLGSTDGVLSRRVINHLARRAGVPVVLACVLEDGALGEIVRVRSGTGCLLCYRAGLAAEGTFDPEPGLDAGYGQGTSHRPMTAVAGDLATVATFAAKATVSTLLELRGYWEQRLPGDFATIGLRPVPWLPPPFDLERAGDVRWGRIGPSRPDCPTCAAA